MDSNNFNDQNLQTQEGGNTSPYTQTVNVGGEPQAPVKPQVQPQVEAPTQPQQPVYQQPMYYQPTPVAEDPAAKSRLAKRLCIISLILYVASPALSSTVVWLSESGMLGSTDDAIVGTSALLSSAAYIAAWVLMIIARVQDKKSVFAKVLMWVYIGIFALSVITAIILIIACIEALRSCGDALSSCPGLFLVP